MKANLKRIGCWCGVFVGFLMGLFLLVIGPWPVSKGSDLQTSAYYNQTMRRIENISKESMVQDVPGTLLAGWAIRDMTPEVGVPMAGYGARPRGKRSTGIRDRLFVKVLTLSDGHRTVAVIGSDMLIIPPNISNSVRQAVREEIPLTEHDLLFTASHTHCGPGGFGPGVAAYVTGGQYDPEIPIFLQEMFTEAIVAAYQSMKPSEIAIGKVKATEYIRNRTREAPVDDEIDFLVVRQSEGDECHVVRFSAHPTVFSHRMMEFSAEFPGALMRTIERKANSTAIYLGGSVGSCSPRAPEAADSDDRVEALGTALADLILSQATDLEFKDRIEISSLGIQVDMPPFQIRPFPGNPGLRLSPILPGLIGLPKEGWFQVLRIGDAYLVGTPFDFSGEISLAWKIWAERSGWTLWPLSFSGTYCGYISPDEYHNETPLGYETGMMSWYGGHMEAYFTDLLKKTIQVLG